MKQYLIYFLCFLLGFIICYFFHIDRFQVITTDSTGSGLGKIFIIETKAGHYRSSDIVDIEYTPIYRGQISYEVGKNIGQEK